MNYFNSTMTADEAKKEFRRLAVQLHPDKATGSHSLFIQLQREYERFLQGNCGYSTKDSEAETSAMNEFIKANDFIQSFVGCTVELVGTWVYLCGNTYPYKDAIKENGFRFSGTKKKWYKAPYELKAKVKRGTSFDKITAKYGYQAVTIGNNTARIK